MTALYETRLATTPVAAAPVMDTVKNIALFALAPFVGLAYLVAFPVVGFAILAWTVARAAAAHKIARTVGMAAAAPAIGLGFVVLFPFVGLALLVWTGGRALLTKAEAEAEVETEAPVYEPLALAA